MAVLTIISEIEEKRPIANEPQDGLFISKISIENEINDRHKVGEDTTFKKDGCVVFPGLFFTFKP